MAEMTPRSFEVRNIAHHTIFCDNRSTAQKIESAQFLQNITALDPDTGSMFRLKLPGAIEPPFKLLLENHQLVSERSFICISYCWRDNGTWTPTSDFEPAESRYYGGLPISDLCFREVLNWTEPGEGVWIDQLSINQNDEEEKERTIASMDLIYKRARLVVIVIEDTILLETEAVVIENLENSKDVEPDFKTVLTETSSIVWDIVSKIGNTRWFQRAWCSHEFHICRDAVFVIPRENGSPISLQLDTLQLVLRFKRWWIPASAVSSSDSEGYGNVVFLLTSRYILTENICKDKPVVGVSYLANSLQASVLGDKVSIVLNLLDLGLYFHGTVMSHAHCRYIFTLLALAVGDPMAICCTGEALDNGDSKWTEDALDMAYLQWPATSDLVHFSNLYPRPIRNLSDQIGFQRRRMTVDVLVLPLKRVNLGQEYLSRSRQFFKSIFKDLEILAIMEPEEWAEPVFDQEAFLERGVAYIACALELGVDWMSSALVTMGCSPNVPGLRPDCSGLGDSLWRSATEHLLPIDEQDQSRKPQVVGFLTFALQHILMLGKTDQKIFTITLFGPVPVQAIVSVPASRPPEDFLLAVPVFLAGAEYAFIKRLWLLHSWNQEPGVYHIGSKGYIWGCGALCKDEVQQSSATRIQLARAERRIKAKL